MKQLHPRFDYHDSDESDSFLKILSADTQQDYVDNSSEDNHDSESLSRSEFAQTMAQITGLMAQLIQAVKERKPDNIILSPTVQAKLQPSRKIVERNAMGQIVEVRDEPLS